MIPRSEWFRVIVFALVIMALTWIPYGVGYAGETPPQQFSGFVIGVDDGHSYIAKMRHGADGHWNFYLFYTSEPHNAAPLIFLPYIVPGQLVGLFVDDANLYSVLVTVFHLLRTLFGVLLLLAMYRFISAFIESPPLRLLALVVAAVGGGLGVLVLAFGATPPEWFIPEGFTFLILLSLPHLALARAAMLGGFLALFASASGRRGYAALASGLWLITALSVPFYLVVIYAILGMWGLLLWARRRAFPVDVFVRCLIAGGGTLPLFVYYVWVFSANPAFAQWSAQNTLPAPPVHHYLLAYAPFLIAGAFAVKSAWRSDDERQLLLLAWALVGLVMVYAPLSVQRRLAEGVIVPLAILAVMGIAQLRRTDGALPRWAPAALILTTVPTMAFFLLGTTLAATGRPLYTDTATVHALRWLDDHAPPDAVVMSRKVIGNRVPAYTDLRPYVGHGPETLNSAEKEPLAEAFFSEWTAQQQLDWLAENPVDYVFFGVDDTVSSTLTEAFTPLYDEGGVRIFAP